MSGKNISRHLEERRFVDSTTSPINPGYMGGSTTSPLNPGYMGGSTTSPINPGYMGDSTTSPLNPGFLENKENKAPTDGRCQDNVHFQDSCKFVSSPPNGTTDPGTEPHILYWLNFIFVRQESVALIRHSEIAVKSSDYSITCAPLFKYL